MQHKWAKEIKAWADGAEIQFKDSHDINEWFDTKEPTWETLDCLEYRIKPQPKEPQYLYIWKPYDEAEDLIVSDRKPNKNDITDDGIYKLIGKIKLEVDDV